MLDVTGPDGNRGLSSGHLTLVRVKGAFDCVPLVHDVDNVSPDEITAS